MIEKREGEKEKDSIYIHRIIREKRWCLATLWNSESLPTTRCATGSVTLGGSVTSWLAWLISLDSIRPVYVQVPISVCIRVCTILRHTPWSWCRPCILWNKQPSKGAETHTQTVLKLTMQVHMQHAVLHMFWPIRQVFQLASRSTHTPNCLLSE